ncbi:MAG TPA: MerR family transcriptional regulator [Dictyobacter sp.]|nr:MerR family transcriptional regulator [Dictyobacter sp.]
MMEERNLRRIAKHLQDESAQKRVQQNIQRGRNEVTVTIGRAARLFGFSESQLRDWEKLGLIKPMRPRENPDARQTTGQRQYSFSELDKLAIIRELLDEARLTPSAIPHNIDEIWYANTTQYPPNNHQTHMYPPTEGIAVPLREMYINKRITDTYREMFGWRFYASHVLWLALLLVYEEVPGFHVGLALPAYEQERDFSIINSFTISDIGDALVGWIGPTRSFFTFLTTAPTFEYPSDYVIRPLCPPDLLQDVPESPANRTLMIVQREEVEHIHRNATVISTVQRLLEPIYADRQHWHTYLGQGMRDLIDPGMDFTPKITDAVLTDLADMTIRLGGKTPEGRERWHSCCILLPIQTHPPLQQRSLIVRAQSKNSRHTVNVTTVMPERHTSSLSLRAYQSGHVIFRHTLSRDDPMTLYREIEGPIRSNIAVPIGGEQQQPLGVMYVNSFIQGAFAEEDQRILRIIAKLLEELLCMYQTRQRISATLRDLLEDPTTVDPFFKEFPSENEFLRDIETLLTRVQMAGTNTQRVQDSNDAERTLREISFIAIDLDSDAQEIIANSYGDQTLQNLNKAIGLRIRDLLPALFTDYLNCKLYHMYAGRYYLFLRDFSLEKTKNNAERLRKALEGTISVKQSELPGGTLMLPDVSVHLGVTWYGIEKLRDFLNPVQRRTLSDISSTMYHSLDFVLKLGTGLKGGNIVYAYEPAIQTFAPYKPNDERK